jgi:hypothetical protein
VQDKVNQAVENGQITQERADEILANAPDRIDQLIDREGLPRCHRGDRPPEEQAAPEAGVPAL